MQTVDDWIDEALAELELPSSSIRELPPNEARMIYHQAMHKFVDGNPRVWWLKLKKKHVSTDADESGEFRHLKHNWPSGESSCYFIPENESGIPRVFDVTLEGVINLLSSTHFFEYNLVGKQLHWLMIENDHDELLILK